MKIMKAVAMSTAIGVALAGLALGSSASADPVSNGYVAVGSDTLQDSMNALTNGTNVTGPFVRVVSQNVAIGNFDAFPIGSAIQTKPGGPSFGRPSGSGEGISALRTSVGGTTSWTASNNTTPGVKIADQVDIARSSSGPSAVVGNGLYIYYPYARDAVGYIYRGGNAAWANITKDDLKKIYDGTLTTVGGLPITPRLPQTTSGTRNFFLGALGYSAVNGVRTAPAVNDSGNTTAENDARVLNDGEIIPFSAASWIAQANGAAPLNTTTAVTGISFGSPLTGKVAFTGTAPTLAANATYYSDTTFGRDTYLVVEYARVNSADPKYDANLFALMDYTNPASLTNFDSVLSASVGSVKKKFGFLAPSTNLTQRAFTANL